MEEIIRQVTERAGISEAQARTAVETVVGFLKNRLPEPVGSQLDGLVGGATGAVGGLADTAGNMLGGMFGGKKE